MVHAIVKLSLIKYSTDNGLPCGIVDEEVYLMSSYYGGGDNGLGPGPGPELELELEPG